VGGPAGAAVIAAAAVNVSATVVDVVAAHNPDNAFLGDLSTTLSVASMVTPQGAAKKIVGEGLEVAITQAGRHVDDIVDVAKAVPTPPTQLAEDVANSAMPKIPNAPPGTPQIQPGTTFTPSVSRGIYDNSIAPNGNLYCTYCGSRIYIQEGKTLRGDIVPPNRAQMDHYIPRSQGGNGTPENGNPACMACNGTSGKGDMVPDRFETNRERIAAVSRERIGEYEQQHGTQPDGVIRTPNDRASTAADQQRKTAQENAQQNNNSGANRSSNNDSGSNSRSRSSSQKKDKKSKLHHPRPTG
jgi:hypothetical protein